MAEFEDSLIQRTCDRCGTPFELPEALVQADQGTCPLCRIDRPLGSDEGGDANKAAPPGAAVDEEELGLWDEEAFEARSRANSVTSPSAPPVSAGADDADLRLAEDDLASNPEPAPRRPQRDEEVGPMVTSHWGSYMQTSVDDSEGDYELCELEEPAGVEPAAVEHGPGEKERPATVSAAESDPDGLELVLLDDDPASDEAPRKSNSPPDTGEAHAAPTGPAGAAGSGGPPDEISDDELGLADIEDSPQPRTHGEDDGDADYEVWTGGASPPEGQPVYIPIICRVCRTRFYGTDDQVGQSIGCPDCKAKNVVPPPPKQKVRVVPPGAEEANFQMDGPVKPLTIDDLGLARVFQQAAAAKAEAKRTEEARPVKTRVEQRGGDQLVLPFLVGIVGYPLHMSVLPRMLGVGLAGAAIAAVANYALDIGQQGLGAVAGVLLLIVVCITGLIWTAFAASLGMGVLQVTSDGEDDLEPYFDGVYLTDKMVEAGAFAVSLFYAAAPGLLLYALARVMTEWGWPAIPLSAFVFLPFVLLSGLQEGSPVIPYSRPIWEAMVSSPIGCIFFYLETFALFTAASVSALVIFFRPGTVVTSVAVVALVLLLVLYFRLLGRLAWYLGQRLAEMEEEKEQG